ncbi:MAG: transketolase family protein [Negativicutes bacterium]
MVSKTHLKEKVAMRDAYCQTLIELASQDERIVAVDADVMNSMGTVPFQQAFPERSFNCGIQEANMIGVAAGLSATGKIPFAHTFGVFATRRVLDQVFVSCSYAKLNVKIIGGDPGITAAFNGGTHMPFEDLGIMRGIPEMVVIEPTDSTMMRDITRQIAGMYGVCYIRSVRKNAVQVYEEGSRFEIGKAALLRDGKDVTIIATGLPTSEALIAADMLEKENISARVLNMFTIKPIDREAIISAARETGAIVTAENHNIINGLGSAVAEVLVEEALAPMERVGVQDLFGEVGSEDYLRDRFGLSATDIVAKVRKVMSRKM